MPQRRVKSPRQHTAFKEAIKPGPCGQFRLDSFLFCFNLPGAAAEVGRRRLKSPAKPRLLVTAAAPRGSSQVHPPPSFAIHRVPLPSPHHVTAAWTPGLFFPSTQPHCAGAWEPIHSNCVTMSPGAQQLRELPSSVRTLFGPEEGGASLGSPTPGWIPTAGQPPTLRPHAGS